MTKDNFKNINKLMGVIPELFELPTDKAFESIYFLLDGDEIVYVGRSRRVMKRTLIDHQHTDKTYDRVFILPRIWASGDAEIIESNLILLINPKYNQRINIGRFKHDKSVYTKKYLAMDFETRLKTIRFEIDNSLPVFGKD